MNSAQDRDVRIVSVTEAPSAPSGRPVSPAAARARRYRARKRGEDAPKRKPGPEPRSAAALSKQVDALSMQVDALRHANRRLTAQVAESQKLTPMLRMQRQRFTLAIVGQLLSALRASDPVKDAPALREALRDLGAAIEARHDQWLES